MQLFVLDEDGLVVFEFNTDTSSDGRGYHLNSDQAMQAKVVKTITGALRFLLKIRKV